MDSRLDAISGPEWEALASKVGYRASMLARSVNVSRQHLARYFQERFKLPPKAWLTRQMVREACSHLGNGEPVKAFYDTLGFQHPNDFSRAFRRLTSLRPTSLAVRDRAIPHKEALWSPPMFQ